MNRGAELALASAGLTGFVLYRIIELNRSCRVKVSREFEKPMKAEPRFAGEL